MRSFMNVLSTADLRERSERNDVLRNKPIMIGIASKELKQVWS